MSEPFLAEVKMVGFTFAPRNWALCDGQILPINQNQSLYSLLGTTYGGDGRTVFALPDLRGRVPVHTGNGFSLGHRGGEEVHYLSVSEIPSHDHAIQATNDVATAANPAGNVLAKAGADLYGDLTSPVNLHSSAVGAVGSGQGHQNMQPFMVLNFAIALIGIFPSRTSFDPPDGERGATLGTGREDADE